MTDIKQKTRKQIYNDFYENVVKDNTIQKSFCQYTLIKEKRGIGFYSVRHEVIYHNLEDNTYWSLDWQEDKFHNYSYEFELHLLTKEDTDETNR